MTKSQQYDAAKNGNGCSYLDRSECSSVSSSVFVPLISVVTDLVGCWWLDIFGRAGASLACATVFALNGVVDFLSVHRNGLWRLDAEANFVTANVNDGNHDIIADHDAFVAVS